MICLSLILGCKKEDTTAPTINISYPENNASFDPNEEIVISANSSDEQKLLYSGYFIIRDQGDTVFSQTEANTGKRSFLNTKLNTETNPLTQGNYFFKVVAANEFKITESVRSFSMGFKDINDSLATYARITHKQPASIIVNVQILNSNFTGMGSYPLNYVETVSPIFYSFGSKIYSSDTYSSKIKSFDKLSGQNFETLYNLYNSNSISPEFYQGDQLYIYNHNINNNIERYSSSGVNTQTFSSIFSQPYSVYQKDQLFFTNEMITGISNLVVYNQNTGAKINNQNIPFGLNIEGFYDLGDPNRIYFLTKRPGNDFNTSIWYYNKSLNSLSQLATNLSGSPKNLNPLVIENGTTKKAWIFTSEGVYEHRIGDVINKIIPATTTPTSLGYIDRYEYSKEMGILLYHTDYNYHVSYDVKNNVSLHEFNQNSKVVLLKD